MNNWTIKCLGLHVLLDHVHIVRTQCVYTCNGHTYDIYIYIYIYIYTCTYIRKIPLFSVGLAHARPN